MIGNKHFYTQFRKFRQNCTTQKHLSQVRNFKYDKCVVGETSLELYKSHPRKMFPDFMDLFYMWLRAKYDVAGFSRHFEILVAFA